MPKFQAETLLMTVPEKKARPVVLVSVETPLVPVAMLDAILIVAVPVTMFGTAIVVATMKVALVAAFEMARSGEVPTPTIITPPCFRLRSQSDQEY